MKSKLALLFILLLTVQLFTSCSSDGSPPAAASFSTPTGTGHLRKSGTLWIVNLEGSYTDMGRQYGALLKKELAGLFIKVDQQVTLTERGMVALIKNKMETRESQLLAGMAMESGLSSDQLELLNATLLFMYTTGGCSACSATGTQTVSGHTIAGRNLDNPRGVFSSIYSNHSIMVIYNPKQQFTGNGAHRDNSVAIMTEIGWLYGLTNLNSKGLYLEYNNATNSIPIILKNPDGTPNIADLQNRLATQMDGLHQNLYASFDCDTLADLDRIMTDPQNRPAVATMTQVADQNQVWHYERTPYEISKMIPAGTAIKPAYAYDNPKDMDIFTNHFYFDTWQNQNLAIYTDYANRKDTASRSFARLTNLQNLAVQAGPITPEKMMQIMTTRLLPDDSGGPFIDWGFTNPDVTYFTSVTDIANRVMHIYPNLDIAPQWATVDLKHEFRSN